MTENINRNRRGFTLVELLIVISIIALLISIILPALAGAKEQAKRSACLTNVRALLQGIKSYLTESNDTFPLNGVFFPKGALAAYPNADNTPNDWTPPHGVVYKEINQQIKTFYCPTDFDSGMGRNSNISSQVVEDRNLPPNVYAFGGAGASPATPAIPPGTPVAGYFSYSVNTVLNSCGQFRSKLSSLSLSQPWTDPLKETNIQSAQTFLYIIEEDADLSNFNDEVFDPPSFNGSDFLTSRHTNGGNLGFADGHAEWQQAVPFNYVPLANPMGSPFTQYFWPGAPPQ